MWLMTRRMISTSFRKPRCRNILYTANPIIKTLMIAVSMRRQLVLQEPWENLGRGPARCRLYTTQMRSLPNLKKQADNMVEGEEVTWLKSQVLEMKQGLALMNKVIKDLNQITNINDLKSNHHNLHNSSDPRVILSERSVQHGHVEVPWIKAQEFCGRRSRDLILVDQEYLDRLRESMDEVKSMYMETKEEIMGLKQLMINIKHVIEDHDDEEANNNHTSQTSNVHAMKHGPVEETKGLRDSRDVITSNKSVEHHQGDHNVILEIGYEVEKLVSDAFDLRYEIKTALGEREGVEAAKARSIDELKKELLLAKSRFSEVERKLIKAMEDNEKLEDDELIDLKYFKWRLKDIGETLKVLDTRIEVFYSERADLFQLLRWWLTGKDSSK